MTTTDQQANGTEGFGVIETGHLRWFEKFPKCRCGKVATGILRGDRNESYGHHCDRCAEKRLKASEKVRQEIEAAT